MPLDTKWGIPAQYGRPDSLDSVLIIEPTLGLDVAHASVNAPLGATPYSENYIIRDGGLEPRPMLTLKSNNAQPIDRVLGGTEVVDVSAVNFPVVSGSTRIAAFLAGSWSVLSYVAAFGVNAPPAAQNTNYYDFTQIYDATANQNIAVFCHDGSLQQLYCWAAGSNIYSTLTGSPSAAHITAFNDFLVAFNTGGNLVQRVQWNDRGSNSSWTGGLSGFADLLDMKGQGNRIMTLENRMVLFSDWEVWQGTPVQFPFTFDFEPIDKGVGCPFPRTAVTTPIGIMFLSHDNMVYLISKYGGPPRAVGQQVQKYLRDNIDQPTRAWATYDRTYNQYQLYFPVKGGSGFPQRALFMNVKDVGISAVYSEALGQGAWALQTYDPISGGLSLTQGFEAHTSSTATTWAALLAAGVQWGRIGMTWAQLGGSSEIRAQLVGSSNGTLYTASSNATSDNNTTVRSIWRSSAMFGYHPNRQKTMNRLRIDYQADSSSSLSLEASRTQGASFDQVGVVSLPANSFLSEAVFHFYTPARYPLFQVSSEAQRYKLFRFWLNVRAGGR